MRPYISEDGRRYALEVCPAVGPELHGPLEPSFLRRFIADMRSVDLDVTGVIAQIFYSGDLIKTSYEWAGLYALAAVFALVLFDFMRIGSALLCLLPVAMGFAATFGVMWLCGMQVNPANIIVLPLMFGIGVDSGVHILHRYRMDHVNRPLGLTAGTGKGVAVTSLTAVIGFGCLVLARHRGIQSLGFTLATGICLTMLACLIAMPAWLELRTRRREIDSCSRAAPKTR